MTRHLKGIGVLAAVSLTFLAACGGGGSPSVARVASVADDASATTTTTAADGSANKADAQQAMLDFAKCMRDHGIDMPDPTFNDDGGGGFTSKVAGPGTDVDKAKMDAAQKACQSYLDKVQQNSPPPDPAKIEEEKQKMLAFAQCMRDHGIDFPDPTFGSEGGGFTVQMGGPGIDPESPGFKEANDACAAQTGMPQPGEGGGPVVGTKS